MPPRRLGRTGLSLSAFGLAVDARGGRTPGSDRPVFEGSETEPNWCDLPVDVRPEEWVEAAGRLVTAEPVVMVRMPPRAWDRSMTDACAGVRSTCDRDTLDIVQLSPFDLERIKGGEPFQALRSLRDRGWVRFFGIGVDSRDDALWVLEHTPAHVLTVDARLEPGAWEEVLGLAGETDSGVIATAAALGHDLDHAKTLLANTSLTAVSWPLPAR